MKPTRAWRGTRDKLALLRLIVGALMKRHIAILVPALLLTGCLSMGSGPIDLEEIHGAWVTTDRQYPGARLDIVGHSDSSAVLPVESYLMREVRLGYHDHTMFTSSYERNFTITGQGGKPYGSCTLTLLSRRRLQCIIWGTDIVLNFEREKKKQAGSNQPLHSDD